MAKGSHGNSGNHGNQHQITPDPVSTPPPAKTEEKWKVTATESGPEANGDYTIVVSVYKDQQPVQDILVQIFEGNKKHYNCKTDPHGLVEQVINVKQGEEVEVKVLAPGIAESQSLWLEGPELPPVSKKTTKTKNSKTDFKKFLKELKLGRKIR